MKTKKPEMMILLHVIVAGFFLPAAILFAITGGLYTFGVKGEYKTKSSEYSASLPTEPKLSEVMAVAESFLLQNGRAENPTGEAAIKKAGTSWQFEWTGSNYDFILEPTGKNNLYKTSVKETSFHRYFVQLHKAKGGMPFKFLASGMALGLLFLFSSGVMIAVATPRMHRTLYSSLAAGFFAFVVLALAS